jgi:hypothetical protein
MANTRDGKRPNLVSSYAIEPHPEYDPSGRTLLVTGADSNVIYSARRHWR